MLEGTVAIVTGAGRGIGRAIALGLAQAGADVVVTAARNSAEAQATATAAEQVHLPGRIIAITADVTREKDCRVTVETAIKHFASVHILVNNAARGMRFIDEDFLKRPTKFWEGNPEAWRLVIDTNVNGPFLMTREVVPHLVRQRWGRIINISINRETMGRVGFSPYGPSKAALEAASAVWARDLAGTGVTVNELLPGGITNTGMVPASAPDTIRRTMLDPAIMTAPLLWLCTPAADQITGGRFVAKDWDVSVPPVDAAQKARVESLWEWGIGGH